MDLCALYADTKGGGDGPTGALIAPWDRPTGVLSWDPLGVPSPVVGTTRLL